MPDLIYWSVCAVALVGLVLRVRRYFWPRRDVKLSRFAEVLDEFDGRG